MWHSCICALYNQPCTDPMATVPYLWQLFVVNTQDFMSTIIDKTIIYDNMCIIKSAIYTSMNATCALLGYFSLGGSIMYILVLYVDVDSTPGVFPGSFGHSKTPDEIMLASP